MMIIRDACTSSARAKVKLGQGVVVLDGQIEGPQL